MCESFFGAFGINDWGVKGISKRKVLITLNKEHLISMGQLPWHQDDLATAEITAGWQMHKKTEDRRDGFTDRKTRLSTLYVLFPHNTSTCKSEYDLESIVLVFPNLPTLTSLSLCTAVSHFVFFICTDCPGSEWWMTTIPFYIRTALTPTVSNLRFLCISCVSAGTHVDTRETGQEQQLFNIYCHKTDVKSGLYLLLTKTCTKVMIKHVGVCCWI